MAITNLTNGAGLTRVPPTSFDARQSWTRAMWVQYTLDPGLTGDFYTTFELYSAGTVGVDLWDVGAYAYRDPGVGDAFVQDIEVNTPNGDFQYAQAVVEFNRWYYFAMRYTAGTGTFDLILDGAVIASCSADMTTASLVGQVDYLLGTPAGAFPASYRGNCQWAERFWQASLSLGELQTEQASRVPVRTSGLLSASSLYTPNQLTDCSGNARNWALSVTPVQGHYFYQAGPMPPVVYSKVFTFVPRSGTGVQTITGVADAYTGAAFDPALVLFHSGVSPAGTLTNGSTPGGSANAFADNRGVDTGILGCAGGSADRAQFANLKIVSAGGGFRYSLIETLADAFFGGAIGRKAYMSTVRVGSFDLTYDQNGPGSFDTILGTAFGGDLNLENLTVAGPGNQATTSELVGLFRLSSVHGLTAGKAVDNGAGGGAKGYGFSARDSGQGSMQYSVLQNSFNRRLQRTDTFYVDTGSLGSTCYVANWNPTSIRYGGVTVTDPTVLGVGGSGVKCWGGAVIQPGSTGNQRVEVGFRPLWILAFGYGREAGAGLLTDWAELGVGWADGAGNQGTFWCGESAVNNAPLFGARFLQAGAMLRFAGTAGPNGVSTVFGAAARVAGVDDTGLTLEWTTVDAVARQILVFVIGMVTAPPVTPTGCIVAEPGATAGPGGCGVVLPGSATGPQGCTVPEPGSV